MLRSTPLLANDRMSGSRNVAPPPLASSCCFSKANTLSLLTLLPRADLFAGVVVIKHRPDVLSGPIGSTAIVRLLGVEFSSDGLRPVPVLT